MKFSYVFLSAFLLAVLINISASADMMHQPLKSTRFWLATVLTTGAFTGYALWISYIRIHFSSAGSGKFARFSKRNISFLYFFFALVPIYVVHLTMIAIVGEALDIVQDIVLHYLIYYMPTIVVLTFLYAFILWHKQKCGLLYHVRLSNDAEHHIAKQIPKSFALEAQRRAFQNGTIEDLPSQSLATKQERIADDKGQPAKFASKRRESAVGKEERHPVANKADKTDRSRFDNESYPQNLYYFLIEKGGSKLLMRGAAPRFLDIVFIHSASRWRYVILRNGEKLQADAVLNQLKQRELDKWMLKISANIYVNMQLVIYPIKRKGTYLELQPDVVAALLEKHSLVDQKQLLKIGRGMPKDLLERFVENVKTMDHKGWDDYIPLT